MDVNRPITEPDTCLSCDGTGLNPLHRNAQGLLSVLKEFVAVCDSAPPMEVFHQIGNICKTAKAEIAKVEAGTK